MDIPSQFKADEKAARQFTQDLLIFLKYENLNVGIKLHQAMHLHSRLRKWVVTYPNNSGLLNTLSIPLEMIGQTEEVDILNFILTNDVNLAYWGLYFGTPDDMSLSKHWLSQERLASILTTMGRHLGYNP